MRAAEGGHIEVMDLLLQNHAQVNLKDKVSVLLSISAACFVD